MRTPAFVLAGVLIVLVLGLSVPGVQAAAPSLRIRSPLNNAVIGNGTPVLVIFAVTDFNLTAPGTGGGPNPNEGHVDVYVDGAWTMVASRETIELPLPSGTHDILLRLVSDNGTALMPDVSAQITVTVTQGPAVGTPRITITYVEIAYPDPRIVLDDDVTISFRISDFALVPPGRGSHVPNEGHIAVFLDGVYNKAVTTFEPVPFSDLTDGDHVFTFRLVDDAGQPLNPEASSTITLRIQASSVVDINPYLIDGQIVLAIAIVIVLYYRDSGRGLLGAVSARLGRRKS